MLPRIIRNRIAIFLGLLVSAVAMSGSVVAEPARSSEVPDGAMVPATISPAQRGLIIAKAEAEFKRQVPGATDSDRNAFSEFVLAATSRYPELPSNGAGSPKVPEVPAAPYFLKVFMDAVAGFEYSRFLAKEAGGAEGIQK